LPGALAAEPHEIGIRPEHLSLVASGSEGSLTGTISITEHLGSDTYAYVALEGSEEMIVVRLDGGHVVRTHDRVGVGVDPEMVHVFAQDGRTLASAKPVALEAA
jgi:multiple sugar transport system ATP-binding protein